ncbi:unnamed protein product [Symbiodinium sp. CCMP2592]|nr:unnamed protein product [Symbiodinium sp. CCMP2592]
MGGSAGATRVIGKGQRRLMTKGIKMGSWVAVSYRVPIKQEIDENDTGHYEGRIIDKRIGGQDRESFIELKDVLKVDIDGNIIGKEKQKRLIDAFIEDCKVIDKRDETWDAIKTQSEAEAAKLQAPPAVVNQAVAAKLDAGVALVRAPARAPVPAPARAPVPAPVRVPVPAPVRAPVPVLAPAPRVLVPVLQPVLAHVQTAGPGLLPLALPLQRVLQLELALARALALDALVDAPVPVLARALQGVRAHVLVVADALQLARPAPPVLVVVVVVVVVVVGVVAQVADVEGVAAVVAVVAVVAAAALPAVAAEGAPDVAVAAVLVAAVVALWEMQCADRVRAVWAVAAWPLAWVA